MIAVGLSNILGSFFLSLPTTGSFTRTAVNNASGVCTPLGGLFTGENVKVDSPLFKFERYQHFYRFFTHKSLSLFINL